MTIALSSENWVPACCHVLVTASSQTAELIYTCTIYNLKKQT